MSGRGRLIAAALVIALLLGFSIRLPGSEITSLSRVLDRLRRSHATRRRWSVARRARGGARAGCRRRRHLRRDHAVCVRDVVRPRHSREGPRSLRRSTSTPLFYRHRAGLRRRPRAGALRDDRHARSGGAGRARHRRDRSRASDGACSAVAGALDPARSARRADPDQPERRPSTRRRDSRRCRHRSRSARRRRRSIASSRSCRRRPSSSSCRSASRRSTSATCSIRRGTGDGSSTATAAARRTHTGCWPNR